MFRIVVPHADCPAESRFQAFIVQVVKEIAVPFLIRLVRVIRIKHRTCQTTGVSHHRDRTVFHRDQLCQTAGLKGAGDKDHVRSCIDQMGQFFIVGDFKMAIRIIIQGVLDLPEVIVDSRVGT